MRYRVVLLLFIILFVLAGCTKPAPASSGSAAAQKPPGETPQASISAPVAWEYGEVDSILDNAGPLYTYLLYPHTGIPAIDREIEDWAAQTYENATNDIAELAAEDADAAGELNVQYNSYLLNNAYVGIEETGSYINTGMAHALDFFKTFNIDIVAGTLLANDQILDASKTEEVLKMISDKLAAIHPDEAGSFDDLDAALLDNIVLTHEGVTILIARGTVLPTYLGSQQIGLTYEELGDIYILPDGNAVPPATEPEQKPGSASNAAGGSAAASAPIDPNLPMVALTFDDGPSAATARILTLLEENGGRATFCVVGNRVEKYADTIRQATAQGCQVIGHSWDHKDLTKLPADSVWAELGNTADIIEAANGIRPTMFRPPYGASNDAVRTISKELGFALITWNVDTLDWKTKNADKVYAAVMKDVSDGSIILCHDLYDTTADAMERVIPELIAQGYQLVTVEELLSFSQNAVEPGNVYTNR
jgi:peptidoglycan/xylan/chitin deacetylase (PgdA/CDA1 family)